VLDADVVMRGVHEWLEEARNHAWHKRGETWDVERWLELLPFTDKPDAVIEAVTKVKELYGRGYRIHFTRVLDAVASVPGAEGEALLADLARAHKDVADDFEWMKVMLGRDSIAAVVSYVDLYIEGVFTQGGPHGANPWHVGRDLAAYVHKFPQLKAEMKKRYEAIGGGDALAMLEYFFCECGDEEDLIAMVEKYTTSDRKYDGRMAGVVRSITQRRQQVEDSPNAFYIHLNSVARVRKFLFGLLFGNPREGAMAKSCLIVIDQLRDEYGIAANDTRHPDVLSEIPWPAEAG
jgi:hypothetical protein